ncbi:di-heme oxidoredictase family protein [Agarilytica rhodophyticola]|uniref:di-heme oxidoredictase family protein n=1 Tax=Agarilytica rhodophyticola TaxID=1737490 RepID=UPI000B345D93|nr:di-heme oxidoredictase family protein [Agarilytica rhodophyticola]
MTSIKQLSSRYFVYLRLFLNWFNSSIAFLLCMVTSTAQASFPDRGMVDNIPMFNYNGQAEPAINDVNKSLPEISGIYRNGPSSVTFFVNSNAWSDVHYSINTGNQLNVRMHHDSGRNTYTINNLSQGDRISFNFTYWNVDHAVDTKRQTYRLSGYPAPTASVTPTPTSTPIPTNIPSPTSTPVPSPTYPPSPKTVVPLFDPSTKLEPVTQFDRGDALVTRFADRGRDRHAKEDEFQAYDHYLTFYWEHRTAAIEIVDYVAKGGNSVRMNVTTQWRLDDTEAENRWFYRGVNTVAEYYDNGTMNRIGDFHYYKERNWNVRENRPIQIGDKIEFEISQFLTNNLPRGRANYYGTTYLYIVGEGLVPWDTNKGFVQGGPLHQEDSFKIPKAAWLGGNTTLPSMETNEPDNHFMQMATNLGYDNGQPFVKGRRIHHTSFVDGAHDENPQNGIFSEMVGKAGNHYINQRCSDCHERNGRAAPPEVGQTLDKWVFKVGDTEGKPDVNIGRVLQPKSANNAISEGEVTLAFWEDVNGLRKPHYQFTQYTPVRFSARIAPQLVGLGLLEAIAETLILAREDPEDRNGDGISGRAQKLIDPVSGDIRLGRFGWKAGSSSLRHQIAAALNTDIGVMTSVLPEPDCGTAQNDCGRAGSELGDEHLNNLVKYIALLGVRPQRNVSDSRVKQGKALFSEIGCADCHTPTLQTSPFHPFAELREQTIHPYSDLLLHDMGPGLADSLGEGEASGSEWRTTPLWGLGLSACVTGGVINPTGRQGDERCSPVHSYLHDGRARSIEEAIFWHGGEGQKAKQNYKSLQTVEKQNILIFLQSL